MIFKALLTASILFLNSCEAKRDLELKKIANIPEASGVCYSKISKTLFVVGDEGRVYEISKDGEILKKRYLGKKDFEGIACDDKKKRVYIAVEGKDNILILDQENLRVRSKLKIKREYRGRVILKKDWKNHGLEGITLMDDKILLSNQSNKFLPKKDPSIIFEIDKKMKKKAKINSLIDPHIKDISGLDYKDGYLYFVSDHNDRVYKLDLKRKKIIKSYKLPSMALEGVAIDEKSNIYFADDNGYLYRSQIAF